MKRSDQVVLTTLFLAAVSSYAAKAQDVMVDGHRDDSAATHHTGANGVPHSGGHFFSFLHHSHHNNPSPAQPPTNAPRTHGFGISLRTTSSAHS